MTGDKNEQAFDQLLDTFERIVADCVRDQNHHMVATQKNADRLSEIRTLIKDRLASQRPEWSEVEAIVRGVIGKYSYIGPEAILAALRPKWGSE